MGPGVVARCICPGGKPAARILYTQGQLLEQAMIAKAVPEEAYRQATRPIGA